MSKPKTEWTEAHQREALRYLLRHADGLVATHAPWKVGAALAAPSFYNAQSEMHLRGCLARQGLSKADEDRAIARVRALAEATPEVRAMVEAARADHDRVVGKLAEGRLVRETVWHARNPHGGGVVSSDEAKIRRIARAANARAKSEGRAWCRVVRMTRIRRPR